MRGGDEPLPVRFTDRWGDRREAVSFQDGVCWHLLLGGQPPVRALAADAQQRLAGFGGLHMTPLRWLHITVLLAGSAGEMTREDTNGMLARARALLSGTPPVAVALKRVVYHPEGIALAVAPKGALDPVLAAARAATSEVTGMAAGDPGPAWMPHMTLCYSTGQQPAAPVIAALGRELPGCEVTIDTLSLVIQRGPELLWDWRPIGAADLLGGRGGQAGRAPRRDGGMALCQSRARGVRCRHPGACPGRFLAGWRSVVRGCRSVVAGSSGAGAGVVCESVVARGARPRAGGWGGKGGAGGNRGNPGCGGVPRVSPRDACRLPRPGGAARHVRAARSAAPCAASPVICAAGSVVLCTFRGIGPVRTVVFAPSPVMGAVSYLCWFLRFRIGPPPACFCSRSRAVVFPTSLSCLVEGVRSGTRRRRGASKFVQAGGGTETETRRTAPARAGAVLCRRCAAGVCGVRGLRRSPGDGGERVTNERMLDARNFVGARQSFVGPRFLRLNFR